MDAKTASKCFAVTLYIKAITMKFSIVVCLSTNYTVHILIIRTFQRHNTIKSHTMIQMFLRLIISDVVCENFIC